MEIQNSHHIVIIASDYKKSKVFYTEIVGCTIYIKNEIVVQN
jgi:catechol 2,3-dioxygenase-like lactoylglutathione lyase family enzyme